MARRGFFWPDKSDRGDEYQRRYALYELIYTAVDFLAAALFVVGSILFFFKDYQEAGTWCFLVGSICFAAKPTLRLVREVRLAEHGDVSELAERLSPAENPGAGVSGQSGEESPASGVKEARDEAHPDRRQQSQ